MTGALARLDAARDRLPEFLLIAFVVFAAALAGTVGVRSFKQGALIVVTLVVLLLVSRKPVVLAAVALAGVYAVQRLGSANAAPGSAGGISYSDALVTAASIMALPALASTPELRRLRGAAYAIAVYLALLLPGLAANRSTRAYLEGAHRLVMLGGALLVGAWLVREGYQRTALRLLTIVSCVVAVLAIQWTFTHGFNPAAPSQWNKNFIGAIFSAVLVLVLAAPQAIGWPPILRWTATILIAGGLLSSQSRGSEIAAAGGLLVALLLNPRAHSIRVRIFAGLTGIAIGVVAAISIKHQFAQNQQTINTSSIGVRFNVEHVTQKIWRTSPFVGVGLKYFFTGHFGPFAYPANNVIDNELAESGVIGLLGFVLFQIGVLAAAVKRRGAPLVAAAAGMIFGQLLHGMVDIFWSAGVSTLPYLILGMALAAPEPATLASGASARVSGAHRAD